MAKIVFLSNCPCVSGSGPFPDLSGSARLWWKSKSSYLLMCEKAGHVRVNMGYPWDQAKEGREEGRKEVRIMARDGQ